MSRALFNRAPALLIKSKNARNANEFMSAIVAKRLVEHLERAGFVIIKRPPIAGVGGDSSTDYPGDAVQGRIIKS